MLLSADYVPPCLSDLFRSLLGLTPFSTVLYGSDVATAAFLPLSKSDLLRAAGPKSDCALLLYYSDQ